LDQGPTEQALEALFALYSLQVWEASAPRTLRSSADTPCLLNIASDTREHAGAENCLDAVVFEFQKAPTQEDYIRGSLYGQRYRLAVIAETCRQGGSVLPSRDLSSWAMRLLKDFICLQLELTSLLADDFAMELLVDGHLVPLSVPLAQVIAARKDHRQPIVVTYRLAGLDGDATEPLFSGEHPPVVDSEIVSQPTSKSTRLVSRELLLKFFVRCGGLEQLIRLVPYAPSTAIRQLAEHFAMMEAFGPETMPVSSPDSTRDSLMTPTQAERLLDLCFLAAAQAALSDTAEHVRAGNQLLELAGRQPALQKFREQPPRPSTCAEALFNHALRLFQHVPINRERQTIPTQRSVLRTIEKADNDDRERLCLRLLARFVDASSILDVLGLELFQFAQLEPERWPVEPFQRLVQVLSFLPRSDIWIELDNKQLFMIFEKALEHLVPSILQRVATTEQCDASGSFLKTIVLLVEQVIHILQEAYASAPASTRSHLQIFPSKSTLGVMLAQLGRQPSALGNATEDLNEMIRAEQGPGARCLEEATDQLQRARREAARQARQRAQAAIQRQAEVVSKPSLEAPRTIQEVASAPGTCIYCRETNASHPDDPLCAYVVLTELDLAAEWNLASTSRGLPFSAEAHAPGSLPALTIQTAFHLVHEQCHRQAVRIEASSVAGYLGVPISSSRPANNSALVRALTLFPLYLHGDTPKYATLLRNVLSSLPAGQPSHSLYPAGYSLSSWTSPLQLRSQLLASLAIFLHQLVPETNARAHAWQPVLPQGLLEQTVPCKPNTHMPSEAALAFLPHWVAAILYLSRQKQPHQHCSSLDDDDDLTRSPTELLEWELLQSCELATNHSNLYDKLVKLLQTLRNLSLDPLAVAATKPDRLAGSSESSSSSLSSSTLDHLPCEACTPEDQSPLRSDRWIVQGKPCRSLWPLWLAIAVGLVYFTESEWRQIRPLVEQTGRLWEADHHRLVAVLDLVDAWVREWKPARLRDLDSLEWLCLHPQAYQERIARLIGIFQCLRHPNPKAMNVTEPLMDS
jgi:hypothetical protein